LAERLAAAHTISLLLLLLFLLLKIDGSACVGVAFAANSEELSIHAPNMRTPFSGALCSTGTAFPFLNTIWRQN